MVQSQDVLDFLTMHFQFPHKSMQF